MVPKVQRLNNGRPLIEPVHEHAWESAVTFNPACTLIEGMDALAPIIAALPFPSTEKFRLEREEALCFLLYRAQGTRTAERDYTASSLGLAVLSSDLRLLARHHSPIIVPEYAFENLGVEDPRLTRVGDSFVLFYTAYGKGAPGNTIRIAVASSTDLVHWEKHGLLAGDFNTLDNKNAMLFEQQHRGKYLLLHRPMQGPDAMAIHWAEADEVFGTWHTRGLFMAPIPNPAFADTWIGGGAPPLHLGNERYLILYHIGNRAADGSREYDLGIAIADLSKEPLIVRRNEPLLRPETVYETQGDAQLGMNNVVFICGAYFYRRDLYFPYAGADSVVLGGKIGAQDFEAYINAK